MRDKKGEADTLINIALVYLKGADEPEKSLNYFKQALPLLQTLGDKGNEAITLSRIGSIYSRIGQFQQALYYYQQSLPVARSVDDKATEAASLTNIGADYETTGQHQKALDYCQQALVLARAAGDKATEAAILSNIITIRKGIGQP